jgi:hypothetical protein
MVDRNAREGDPPPSRLEVWLSKTIRGGGLRALPVYHPLCARGGQSPELYARMLLAGLRTADADRRRAERLKDDGRAFRSWVESARPVGRGGTAF